VYSIGIDIGSTAAKAAVLEDGHVVKTLVTPTGFNSVDASRRIEEQLAQEGIACEGSYVTATGYGRVSVPFADRVVTEITCHGRGAAFLFERDGTVVDVGGQDTKVIAVVDGKVKKFLMNDKCSAGTGRFLEVMADRMGVTQEELAALAREGEPVTISSMCTVFAESEVTSLVGNGVALPDIAGGVMESVVSKVATMVGQLSSDTYFLTGGLCENAYIVERLAARLGRPVETKPLARYAGALGAALLGAEAAG